MQSQVEMVKQSELRSGCRDVYPARYSRRAVLHLETRVVELTRELHAAGEEICRLRALMGMRL